MSDESRLNPDLKNLEAKLSRLEIPRASINRDELMYQSGWSAAMASLGHETVPTSSVSTVAANQQWIWQATAMAATAATILVSLLLAIQIGSAPGPLNDRQVADAEKSAVETKAANSESKVFSTAAESFQLPTGRTIRESDILNLVLNLPSGQVLKSGLALQDPSVAADLDASVSRPSNPPSYNRQPVNQMQLMDELLPAGQKKLPTWRTIFSRPKTSS